MDTQENKGMKCNDRRSDLERSNEEVEVIMFRQVTAVLVGVCSG